MPSLFSSGSSTVNDAASALQSLIPQFSALSSEATSLEPNFLDLASTFGTESGQIYDPSISQFTSGAEGQVTPAQQAQVNQTAAQMGLGTKATYGNLGLGGSTMETQDLDANSLASLAQTLGFANTNETSGLSGLAAALGFGNAATNATSGALSTITGAGNILGGASGSAASAGNLGTTQEQIQASELGSLGSAIGGTGGLFSSTGLFGSAGPFSSTGIIGSLFSGGGGAGTAAALGTGGLL
jgi:hypothetical protein